MFHGPQKPVKGTIGKPYADVTIARNGCPRRCSAGSNEKRKKELESDNGKPPTASRMITRLGAAKLTTNIFEGPAHFVHL